MLSKPEPHDTPSQNASPSSYRRSIGSHEKRDRGKLILLGSTECFCSALFHQGFIACTDTSDFICNRPGAGVVAGIPFTWPWLADARQSYVGQTALALGAEWRQVGFGATGLARAGSGGAPGALEAFNLFHAGCPRDDWQPDVVVVNQGTNESSLPPHEYHRLYARYLALIRTAYPTAKIVALRPFIGAQEASIKAIVSAYNAAGDSGVYYLDTTGWYNGPLHPQIAGSAALAEKLVNALKSEVLATSVPRK